MKFRKPNLRALERVPEVPWGTGDTQGYPEQYGFHIWILMGRSRYSLVYEKLREDSIYVLHIYKLVFSNIFLLREHRSCMYTKLYMYMNKIVITCT